MEWIGNKVKCDICNHIWIAVFHIYSEKLKCPHCRNMANYELILEEET